MADFDIDTKNLDRLIRSLSKSGSIKIGILGNRDGRSKGTSNATVGAAHEFGTSTLPRRSFLKMPLEDELPKAIEKTKLFTEDVLKEVVKTGSILLWLTVLSDVAKDVVLKAFDTSGYGKWAPWKNPGYSNQTGQILLDTQQLKDSIDVEVKQ